MLEGQKVALQALELDPKSASAAHGGIKHIDYLISFWMLLPMWQSWSEWGRVATSTLLKIPVEGVILTTNHLESFNAILKRKHLPMWLHSGRCLWFDSLIHILIMRILPGIYSHRKAQQEYSDWLTDRFRDHTGGENLAELHRKLAMEREVQRNLPVCFWPFDPVCDAAAEQVLAHRLVSPPQKHDANTYHAGCKSQSTFTGSR